MINHQLQKISLKQHTPTPSQADKILKQYNITLDDNQAIGTQMQA